MLRFIADLLVDSSLRISQQSLSSIKKITSYIETFTDEQIN